jgi:hypothetical protein
VSRTDWYFEKSGKRGRSHRGLAHESMVRGTMVPCYHVTMLPVKRMFRRLPNTTSLPVLSLGTIFTLGRMHYLCLHIPQAASSLFVRYSSSSQQPPSATSCSRRSVSYTYGHPPSYSFSRASISFLILLAHSISSIQAIQALMRSRGLYHQHIGKMSMGGHISSSYKSGNVVICM